MRIEFEKRTPRQRLLRRFGRVEFLGSLLMLVIAVTAVSGPCGRRAAEAGEVSHGEETTSRRPDGVNNAAMDELETQNAASGASSGKTYKPPAGQPVLWITDQIETDASEQKSVKAPGDNPHGSSSGGTQRKGQADSGESLLKEAARWWPRPVGQRYAERDTLRNDGATQSEASSQVSRRWWQKFSFPSSRRDAGRRSNHRKTRGTGETGYEISRRYWYDGEVPLSIPREMLDELASSAPSGPDTKPSLRQSKLELPLNTPTSAERQRGQGVPLAGRAPAKMDSRAPSEVPRSAQKATREITEPVTRRSSVTKKTLPDANALFRQENSTPRKVENSSLAQAQKPQPEDRLPPDVTPASQPRTENDSGADDLSDTKNDPTNRSTKNPTSDSTNDPTNDSSTDEDDTSIENSARSAKSLVDMDPRRWWVETASAPSLTEQLGRRTPRNHVAEENDRATGDDKETDQILLAQRSTVAESSIAQILGDASGAAGPFDERRRWMSNSGQLTDMSSILASFQESLRSRRPSRSRQGDGEPSSDSDRFTGSDSIGDQPEDTSLYFLRRDTVLLRPGDGQFDIGLTYSLTEDELPVAITDANGNVEGVARGRLRQRLLVMPLQFRYGLCKRVQTYLNVPVGWSGNELATIQSDDYRNTVGIGDMDAGASILARQGVRHKPDIVWTFGMTFPTGKDSFPLVSATPDSQLGEGFFALSTSFLFVHNIDPVVLIYGGGYRHRFNDRKLGNKVNPGEQFLYQFGVGFAVNEHITLSGSFLGLVVTDEYINGDRIEGSLLEPMRLRFSATIVDNICLPRWRCDKPTRTIVEPFAEIGMTSDAPSGRIGVVWTF